MIERCIAESSNVFTEDLIWCNDPRVVRPEFSFCQSFFFLSVVQ